MSLVCVDPWSAGNFDVEGEEGLHLSHAFCWVKSSPHDNLYAHPIEGLNPVVDIKRMEVIRVDDYGITPIPETDYNYDHEFVTKTRSHLRAIDIEQPDGVSFTMEGQSISWHDWSLVIGFNAREAITLHDIKFADRPVCYRASLAEMVVPYGSPKTPHYRKNVFDIGEYGLGKLANSLTLGCDCVGAIQYLDCWISDINGEPMCIANGICVHEEDYGILWKHWDFRTDRTEVRRARRLVISSIFCARLDMAVDGDENSVVECNTVAEPEGPANPYGNAYYLQETLLETECGRTRNPDSERYWKFVNPNRSNHVGRPTGYKLEPRDSRAVFIRPDSPSGRRMPFIRNHLWVTAHDPDERYPGGDFMNHSDGTAGLPAYVGRGRSVQNADIVAWHVFGLHHQPRPEDFPVQPCVTTGFKLMPVGFFDTNPTIDLAGARNERSCHAFAAE
jgi:primary-amine oxidase